MKILLPIVFLLSGCAHQDEWITGDTVLQGIAFATMAVDAHMSARIQDHPNIVENGFIAGPILGTNPSTGEMWIYMTTAAISHYLIARALPSGWRRIWQGSAIVRHGAAINSGHQMGLFSQPCTTLVPVEFQCQP